MAFSGFVWFSNQKQMMDVMKSSILTRIVFFSFSFFFLFFFFLLKGRQAWGQIGVGCVVMFGYLKISLLVT